MIKKTITYEDYDGNKCTDDFFFHLTKADLIDWATEEEGLSEKLESLTHETDMLKIVPVIKTIIERSYGKRIGKAFVKKQEILDEFIYTEAFSELYMELASNADALIEFVEGVMPAFDEDTRKAIEEARKKLEKEQKEVETE